MDALIHSKNPSIARRRRLRESVDLTSLLLLLMSLCLSLSAAAEPVRNVLVIYSDNRLLPANLEVDGALRESLVGSAARPIELYSEFLDRSRFAGDAYEATTSTFLAQKYSASVPDVVVAGGEYALRFLLQNRAALFPNVPIVFIGLSPAGNRRRLRHCRKTSSECRSSSITSVRSSRRCAFTQRLPRLVVITGANRFDRRDEARLAQCAARLNGRVSVESLGGLPMDAIVERVRSLGPTDVVFTPGLLHRWRGSPVQPARIDADHCRGVERPGLWTFQYVHRDRHRRRPDAELWRDGQGRSDAGQSPARRRAGELDRCAAIARRHRCRSTGGRRVGGASRKKQLPSDAIIHFKEPTFWEAYGHVGADRARGDAVADHVDRRAAVRAALAASHRGGARSERTADGVGRAHGAPQQLGVECRAGQQSERHGECGRERSARAAIEGTGGRRFRPGARNRHIRPTARHCNARCAMRWRTTRS